MVKVPTVSAKRQGQTVFAMNSNLKMPVVPTDQCFPVSAYSNAGCKNTILLLNQNLFKWHLRVRLFRSDNEAFCPRAQELTHTVSMI